MKTAIVTGASQGMGAGIVNAFVERGFNVVANSRNITRSKDVAASTHVALVDGDIGLPATAGKIVQTAGFGLMGIFESLSRVQIRQQMEPVQRFRLAQ